MQHQFAVAKNARKFKVKVNNNDDDDDDKDSSSNSNNSSNSNRATAATITIWTGGLWQQKTAAAKAKVDLKVVKKERIKTLS